MNLKLLAFAAFIVVALSSCLPGGGEEGDNLGYTPIPDEQLFAEVAALPGVEKADLTYSDDFPESAYVGSLTFAGDADAADVVDHAYAILR